MAIPLFALLAAGGLAKSLLVDKPEERRQRKLAAATTRLSPFTGLQAQPIQRADPIGSALSFGFTGQQLSQNIAAQEAQQNIFNQLLQLRLGSNTNG